MLIIRSIINKYSTVKLFITCKKKYFFTVDFIVIIIKIKLYTA